MTIRAQLAASLKNLVPVAVTKNVKRLFAPHRAEPIRRWRISRADYPWFDQPNALQLLERRRTQEHLSDADYEHLHHWVTDGYCVLSRLIPDQLIDGMLQDLEHLFTSSPPIEGLDFHDLRLREDGLPAKCLTPKCLPPLWRGDSLRRATPIGACTSCTSIQHTPEPSFTMPSCFAWTSLIMGRPVKPEYSINFLYGSSQELHQDSAVFHLVPPPPLSVHGSPARTSRLTAVPWSSCPKSHREPMFERFDNYPQTNLRTATKELEREYHRYTTELGNKYGAATLHCPEGGSPPLARHCARRKSYKGPSHDTQVFCVALPPGKESMSPRTKSPARRMASPARAGLCECSVQAIGTGDTWFRT